MVEGITNLSSPIVQNNNTSISVKQEIAGRGAIPFAFRDLSTGTQQIIILLCQLHSQPENTMILLEEVEAMLHPSAQARLTDLLKQHSTAKTILLATHSHVIASRVNLSSLYLCTKNDGETAVAPVTAESVDRVITELGIMPSYSFEKDIIVFVEGESDEALCDVWRTQYYPKLSVAVINSEGYSKLPFYANAKILRNKAVRIKTFAIVDGDTRAKGDFNRIRNALEYKSDDDILQIDETNIEEFLKLHALGIHQAFPSLSEEQVNDSLQGIDGDGLKDALKKLLRGVGGYNGDTIRKVAPFIKPPTYWLRFFDKIAAYAPGTE
jgi:predicted ATP-dependent endonuclease of OLD family